MMQKSPHLCQLFLILSVLVCFFVSSFVSADNEVNTQLITATSLRMYYRERLLSWEGKKKPSQSQLKTPRVLDLVTDSAFSTTKF